jgi:hypothetical protein
MSDGNNWQLYEEFAYHIGDKYSNRYVVVPAGFETDFASIPPILWRFFIWWLPLWAKFCKGAVLHDWLYHVKKIMGQPITRKEADDIFLESNMVAWRYHKSRYLVARLEYWAVRCFGWLAWNHKTVQNLVVYNIH